MIRESTMFLLNSKKKKKKGGEKKYITKSRFRSQKPHFSKKKNTHG